MENPVLEIPTVVRLLTGSSTTSGARDYDEAFTSGPPWSAGALTQKRAVERYMTPDVEFRHPVCAVMKGRESRRGLLGVYQWYRVLSPDVEVKVDSVVFDPAQNILYLECVQWFKLFFLPIKPAPARLITRLTLIKHDKLYYISKQEDFYHPEDFISLLLPLLAPLIRLALLASGVFSGWLYTVASALGYWQCEEDEKGERDLKMRGEGEGETTPSEAGLYENSDGCIREGH